MLLKMSEFCPTVGLAGKKSLSLFSNLTDDVQIDNIVTDYNSRHGGTTSEPYPTGHFRALGLCV